MKKLHLFLAIAGLGFAMFPAKINDVARGLRNNNPLNIKEGADGGDQWEGEHELDLDPTFEEFKTPVHGIRAGARILRTYFRKYGANTIETIIYRWAPPTGDNGEYENDTKNYIKNVSEWSGIDKDTPLDDRTYPAVIAAMIRMENGSNPYSDLEIRQGFEWGFYG